MREGKEQNNRIVILHHALQPKSDEDAFVISWMARHWQQWGYQVEHQYGPSESVDADLIIIHVDLSVTPDAYLVYARSFPQAVNLGLTDIRKSRISTNLVAADDGYEGPVVVKSDLNHGGTPEVHVGERPKPPPLTLKQRLIRKLGLSDPTAIRDPSNYLVYPRKRQVPNSVYSNPDLVVERFLPEPHGNEFYHRRYLYFGDAEYNEVWAGNNAINFWDDNGDRNWTEPVADELRERRRQLGADYGKIDYVIRENRIEIFDVNRTPAGSEEDEKPEDAAWCEIVAEQLAQGIYHWLPQ